MTDLFAKDIIEYIANNSSGYFTLGSNLMIGEVIPNTDAVYLLTNTSEMPDKETTIEIYDITFFAVDSDSERALERLRYIYRMYHRKIEYYTNNFQVYFSNAYSQVNDLGRTGDGKKFYSMGMGFITRSLMVS